MRKNKYVVSFFVRSRPQNIMFSCVEIIVSDKNSAKDIFESLAEVCVENAKENSVLISLDEINNMTINDIKFTMLSLLDSYELKEHTGE